MDRWMDDVGERRFKDSSSKIDYDSWKHYKRPDAKREREIFVGLQNNLYKLEIFETTRNKKLYRNEIEEVKRLIREDTEIILQGEIHNLRWQAKQFTKDPMKIIDCMLAGAKWMAQSIPKFDLDKGNRFWTFTKKIVKLKMIGALESPTKNRGAKIIRYSEIYDLDEPETMGTIYRLARRNRAQQCKRLSKTPWYDTKIDMELLLWQPTFTDDEFKVLNYCYLSKNKSYRLKDIAEELGMSTTQAFNLKKSGEAELKRYDSLNRQRDTEMRILRRHLIQWRGLCDFFGKDNIRKYEQLGQIYSKDKVKRTKEIRKFISGLTTEEQDCYYDMRAWHPFITDGIKRINELEERYKTRPKGITQ